MKKLACAGFVAALLAGLPSSAAAATIVFELSTEILNTTPGTGDSPALTSPVPMGTLTFTDISPGVVELTIQSSLETAGEFFTAVGWNGSWFPDNNDLLYTFASSTGSFLSPGVPAESNNAFGTGPPSGFDYLLTFQTGGSGGTTLQRFDGTDSITFTITCADLATCGPAGNLLDATDFNTVNNVGLNSLAHQGWFAVASFGVGTDTNARNYGDNTGADNLEEVITAVPEPGTLVLLGAGLMGAAARIRRRARA